MFSELVVVNGYIFFMPVLRDFEMLEFYDAELSLPEQPELLLIFGNVGQAYISFWGHSIKQRSIWEIENFSLHTLRCIASPSLFLIHNIFYFWRKYSSLMSRLLNLILSPCCLYLLVRPITQNP